MSKPAPQICLKHAATGALIAILIVCSAQATDETPKLNLPKVPLIGGQTVDPNVLVAFDGSGSMRSELLFDNKGGEIYWSADRNNPTKFVKPDGTLHRCNQNKTGCDQYLFLFPPNKNWMLAGVVPPYPQFAFTRSPQFNNAYFDPKKINYKPWSPEQYENIVNIHAVPYNPLEPDGAKIDLAPGAAIEASHFTVLQGMKKPDGRIENNDNDPHYESAEYYPATFYIKASSPSDARAKAGDSYSSYKTDKIESVQSFAPGNSGKITLYRFQIKKSNFAEESQYSAAIANFANWFTYHRRRSLATKGALVRAFDKFDNLRAGACTINASNSKYSDKTHPQELTVAKLADNRLDFNSKILNMQIGGGTPDIKALNYMGKQYEQDRSDKPNLIQHPCQKNYAILFTDGYNNETIDVGGDLDGDGNFNTMGDVGYKYYKNLQPPASFNFVNPDMKVPEDGAKKNNQVRVPAACSESDHDPSLDCERALHVNMFAVTLGQKGNIYNGENSPNPYSGNVTWPGQNGDAKPKQIDDLWHATVNSHGALLNATHTSQLVNKFSAVLSKVLNSELAASGLTTNRNTLSTKTLGFRATFTDRQGSLEAFKLDDSTALDVDKRQWSARAVNFQGDKNNPAARDIYTSLPDDDGALGRGVIFKALNLYDAGVKVERVPSESDYANSEYYSPKYNLTPRAIRYLRGDHTDEQQNGGDLRNRNGHVLGAIVHSTPAFVPELPDQASYLGRFTNSYSDFQEDTRGRSAMIYVEANDGMLHGFDADTGEEKFAYIPGVVLPRLHNLTDPDNPDFFYADGSPVVGDVVYGGRWHTVLVAGERGGGDSVFALDVTDPDNFDAGDVLWEASNKTDRIDQLGKTFGKPLIARLNNGKWVALFGNGYNSPANKAVLYVVNIQTGDLIKKFDVTNRDGTPTRSGPNGLSAPVAADLDGDAVIDYAYAGDLHGNLWRFDLSSASSDDWDATRLYTTEKYENSDEARPITSKPNVAGPINGLSGLFVFFGSGRFITERDAENIQEQTNYLYGLWDAHATSSNSPPPDNISDDAISSTQLVDQSRIAQQAESGQTYVAISDNPVNYTDGDRGWRLDVSLDNTGQAITNQPFVGAGAKRLTVTTTVPSAKVCEPGGDGTLYQIDPATGGRTRFISFDVTGDAAFDNSDRIFTISVDGEDSNDEEPTEIAASGVMMAGIPTGTLHLTNTQNPDIDRATPGLSSSEVANAPLNRGSQSGGRISWHEIRR